MNSSAAFAPSIARLLRGLSLMPVRSGMGLALRLAVVVAGRMTNVFALRRIIDSVADHCMMEDRVDRCSS